MSWVTFGKTSCELWRWWKERKPVFRRCCREADANVIETVPPRDCIPHSPGSHARFREAKNRNVRGCDRHVGTTSHRNHRPTRAQYGCLVQGPSCDEVTVTALSAGEILGGTVLRGTEGRDRWVGGLNWLNWSFGVCLGHGLVSRWD